MNYIAIIPAKGISSRLSKKNILPIWNKPMLEWSVIACRESKYNITPWISTDDTNIMKLANSLNCRIIRRPDRLAEPSVYKQEVIRHAAEIIETHYYGENIWISLQPNSPQVTGKHLDLAIDLLLKHQKDELISVDRFGLQNAAFRVFNNKYVFQKDLSTNCMVMKCDVDDIHTQEDFDRVEKMGRNIDIDYGEFGVSECNNDHRSPTIEYGYE